MSIIFLILFLGLIFLLIRPFIRLWLISRKIKQGNFDFINDLFGNPGAQHSSSDGSSSQHRRSGWSGKAATKKKIAKDVGEYVKFQEIKVEESKTAVESDGAAGEFVREEQITDVEWEEIKDE